MIEIDVKPGEAVAVIRGLRGNIEDLTPAFVNFHAYMMRRTFLMFRNLKRGGTFRGVRWAWFAPQYVRKDGTVVPAEGGIPKVRGEGMVKGRKRHSGKRVTKSSSLMRDTGRLYTAALTFQRIRQGRVLVMDTPVQYARYQNELRPFQFFEDPVDVNVLRRMILKRLRNAE